MSELLWRVTIAAVALTIGFVLGRVERRTNAGRPPRERWADIGRVAFGLAAVTAIGVTVLQVQTRSSCQQEFSRAVSQAIADRSQASGDSAEAQRRLIVATLTGDPTQTVPALQQFLTALDTQEQARRAAPLPKPPDCG